MRTLWLCIICIWLVQTIYAQDYLSNDDDALFDELGKTLQVKSHETDKLSENNASWLSFIKFTLHHQSSYNLKSEKIEENISTLNATYLKQLSKNYSVFLNASCLIYSINDPISIQKDTNPYVKNHLEEAYIQMSFFNLSAKIGRQVVKWGELDVFDQLIPENEFHDLELGQEMISVDLFSENGTFSGFYIPFPRCNEDASHDSINHCETSNQEDPMVPEFGIKWDFVLGAGDISFMAARLRYNKPVTIVTGTTTKHDEYPTYTLYGMTIRHTRNSFIWDFESAYSPVKVYSSPLFARYEKATLDSAFRLAYYSVKYTISLTLANKRIIAWKEEIGRKRDQSELSFAWNHDFEDKKTSLSFEFETEFIYDDRTYTTSAHYRFSDAFRSAMSMEYLEISNEDSPSWKKRNQLLLSAKISYAF